jgi:hypothetical protein
VSTIVHRSAASADPDAHAQESTSTIAAIRVARTALIDASREAREPAIGEAVARYVLAMTTASFSRYTVRALVQAALDVGLPRERGRMRRRSRSEEIELWANHALALADALGTAAAVAPSRAAAHASPRILS